MDKDISRWVIEFLLRHSVSDQVIKKILMELPISNNDIRLKKTILLHSIQTEISYGSVSEMILESLKLIEDLDKKEGIKISTSMKAAYRAVAVECTIKYLGKSFDEHNKYLETVKRIWRDEIENLGESELVTAELLKWKDDIEVAIVDDKMCSRLKKNPRNHALQLVKQFLGEEWAIMGPSFLELAVAKMRQLKERESGIGDNVGERAAGKEKGIQRENMLLKHKHIVPHRRTRGRAKITENKELGKDASYVKYDTMRTPEVNEVQEALKFSSLDLRAIVTDPLPDALLRAEALLSERARENQNHVPSVERQNNVYDGVSNPSVNVGAASAQAKEGDDRNQSCSHNNNVPKPSLMEPNHTAHVYEWDDSIDDSPGEPSNHLNRLHLPSPKRKAVSPLKKYEIKDGPRRRKMKRWSVEEEEALRKGVQEFGKGNWKVILKSNPEAFSERTEVDLKDKWRNMMRY